MLSSSERAQCSRGNISPPSWGSRSKPSKKLAEAGGCFCLGSDLEDDRLTRAPFPPLDPFLGSLRTSMVPHASPVKIFDDVLTVSVCTKDNPQAGLRSFVNLSSASGLLVALSFDGCGEIPGIQCFLPGPWPQPVMVSGFYKPFSRLFVHTCMSLFSSSLRNLSCVCSPLRVPWITLPSSSKMWSCSSSVSLSYRIVLLEDSCLHIGQGILVGSWFFRAPWPWRFYIFYRGTALSPWALKRPWLGFLSACLCPGSLVDPCSLWSRQSVLSYLKPAYSRDCMP
jgi:hypothetical protein